MPQNLQQHHPCMAVADVFSSLICIRQSTPPDAISHSLEILKIMEWFPIVAVTFKFLVLGTGMFFAIKWHYDQGRKGKEKERRAVLRAASKVAAVFVILLVVLVLGTFVVSRKLGLDLSFP